MPRPNFDKMIDNKEELGIILKSFREFLKSMRGNKIFERNFGSSYAMVFEKICHAYYKEYKSWGTDYVADETGDNNLIEHFMRWIG